MTRYQRRREAEELILSAVRSTNYFLHSGNSHEMYHKQRTAGVCERFYGNLCWMLADELGKELSEPEVRLLDKLLLKNVLRYKHYRLANM